MNQKLERLQLLLKDLLGDRITGPECAFNELTIEVSAENYHAVMMQLHDNPALRFEQLVDLSGIDYSEFAGREERRFAVTCHLTSLTHNWRLRVRVFAPDENFPLVDSITDVWNCANWYEREAFDLYGILFEGHTDLRRILTDYGFVGHPFRKDFPVSGHVEMRYDAEQKRVIYQPVTIEPREVTPRIVREDLYARGGDRG
ncbi:NADH dehydrogenase [Rugosibacter aromaticivorans]|uniref:NADH-quinone oxidoreductase subunit C n=1 Tax=Rugosibacter aromaticivorans TaxID=1565605 RepID=A0A0C5J074_9PROT|nr:NADH-quinone oxidoreductase subunit C [Rugosibacter aromaticivorans]AJP48457.1 NADH dehydrogenase [Rugosibacter aromaticivorans]TAJ21467.1 MAG: NADH-quinone oxidoreductase subunit C [Rugosibacter sp.]TBR15323.1 MAG: NADH-quinone oxidoreductase subunit C [Rugosibacter sp.]